VWIMGRLGFFFFLEALGVELSASATLPALSADGFFQDGGLGNYTRGWL
jgi:hypothetical protein